MGLLEGLWPAARNYKRDGRDVAGNRSQARFPVHLPRRWGENSKAVEENGPR